MPNKRLKVRRVIDKQVVQEVGDLLIPAPAGLQLDPATGLLTPAVNVTLAATPQIRDTTVLTNKVINQGVVPVQLEVGDVIAIQLLEIPFQAVKDVPGAVPGDEVQKHDIEVEGFSVMAIQVPADNSNNVNINQLLTLNLLIKVIVKLCIIVARETIVSVEANETFC